MPRPVKYNRPTSRLLVATLLAAAGCTVVCARVTHARIDDGAAPAGPIQSPVQPASPAPTPAPAPAPAPTTPPPPPAAPAATGQAEEPPEAVVTLATGEQVEGVLVSQTASGVVLRIGKIDTTFTAD